MCFHTLLKRCEITFLFPNPQIFSGYFIASPQKNAFARVSYLHFVTHLLKRRVETFRTACRSAHPQLVDFIKLLTHVQVQVYRI